MKRFIKIAALLTLIFFGGIGQTQSSSAQSNIDTSAEGENHLYLPLLSSGAGNSSVALPPEMVATWYSGNAPLNDFYNPQTGEWSDVNEVGQMYVFASNGAYTYTSFIQAQIGACRSEVSTFKQGHAFVAGNVLTMTPTVAQTRSVMICGSTKERFTEGPYDPTVQKWGVTDGADGHEQLTIGTAGEAVTYNKAGMVNSLVGLWLKDGLSPQGFYDPATHQFDLHGGQGMWFEFTADSSYRFGEHRQSPPDDHGCYYEWWIYQQGTMRIVGGKITVTSEGGARHWRNPCMPSQPTEAPWLSDTRDYTWSYRDRAGEVKLVMIQISLPFEFVFQRP